MVAHLNERGTNILLIILLQNKASVCTQRNSAVCFLIHTIARSFYCISWHSLKEQLHVEEDTAGKFVRCMITISWF